MSDTKDTKEVKRHILGYGYMLEESMISEFKRLYPDIIMKKVAASEPVEQTERPTIDVSDYKDKPGKALNTNSEGFSFFRADPGFKPRISGKKPMPFIDIDGKIRYKYE